MSPTASRLICGLIALMTFSAHAKFQLPEPDTSTVRVQNTASALPPDWHRGVFMEIFVRAYQDSNNDGIGDLKGLTSRLDYLQSLGVRGIWLMPIHPSQDKDHGYAVENYRYIDPAYGTLEDFDELIREAHKREIGVIIDYVINHSAATHPAFMQSAASSKSRFRDWYMWQENQPKDWEIFGRNPWVPVQSGSYLAQFSEKMPDMNLRNPKVINFHLDNMRFWLNRGVDGFRFDAVAHLFENGNQAWYDQPGNPIFMREIIKELNTHYPNRYMVCEATQNVDTYKNACGSAFAFGYQYEVVRAAKGNRTAIKKLSSYFTGKPLNYAVFASNHDKFAGARLWDQVSGNQAQYKLAAATYLLAPGTPFIYYGEEIGQAGNSALQGDPELRTPMNWNADGSGFSKSKPFRAYSANMAAQNWSAQKDDADGLLVYYRSLITLRNKHEALSVGNYQTLTTNKDVLGFIRSHQNQHALVLINYGKKSVRMNLNNLPASTSFHLNFPKSSMQIPSDSNGTMNVTVPAQSTSVFAADYDK